MATAHYTPTHCPTTGRKFTRSERKAANKARFKAEMAASSPKPKAAKASTPTKASLMRLTKAQLVDLLLSSPAEAEAPKRKAKAKTNTKAKPKRKSTPKARKATPAQRVADSQERNHHGRPDTPVTPQAEAPTADVDAARAIARQAGARNRRQRAFELATRWTFSPSGGGIFSPEQQAELTRLLGSTDVSTYEDVVALTH
jgi:hypothetical protein